MAEVALNITGLAELERVLLEAPKKARLALRIGVSAGAGVVKKEAVRRARAQFKRKTGNLFKGIKVKVFTRRGPDGSTEVVGRVRASAPHSHLLERGWEHTGNVPKARAKTKKRIPARPFVKPAADAKKLEAIEKMKSKTHERLAALRFGKR